MNKYAIVGAGLVLLGLAFVAVPELTGPLSLGESIVTVIGVIALLQGLRTAQARRHADIGQTELPTPERPQELSTPGEEIDAAIESGVVTFGRQGRKLNERLERAVVDALVLGEGLTEDEARQSLENGTWTDDPLAAAQFMNTVPDWAPWRVRVRTVVRRDRPRRARRAAAEIARISGVHDDE
ncbi:hypothetical protein JMJ58_18720 [Haloterrigena salifodinae]|uniref:Uncharacterized protein n=1 Tax=Haloterrigena salifodinae TaxID=2675099 RepID=A0A8T8DZJ4_9EURY|nr:hypothetical protein [Haloterrigena salifodinae]QRV14919.1 hypothetical protein JMJ58_18720 [Haloterrigena salifodinae]